MGQTAGFVAGPWIVRQSPSPLPQGEGTEMIVSKVLIRYPFISGTRNEHMPPE
jgi:hypothetical protein